MPGAPTTEDYGNYQFLCIKKFGKYCVLLIFSLAEIQDNMISNFYYADCNIGQLTISSCSASTEYSSGYTCTNTFDGNEGREWATRSEGVGAWIKVNLNGLYQITKIMFLQRNGEYFKDISLEFLESDPVDFTLSASTVWEDLELDERNINTNYVKISAINVHTGANFGFSELKVFGCAQGIYINIGYTCYIYATAFLTDV